VEYALKNSKKPIAVASYRITSTLPRELRNFFFFIMKEKYQTLGKGD